ncbi:MAG: sensor histidine kinase [Campylobacterota bacterium]
MKQDATILIIEDTPSNIDMLTSILQAYDLIPTLNGRDGLDVLRDEHVDLILLDIMMPHMDGFEVCQKIKADPAHKNTPVMFITAKSQSEDITKGFELGAVDYITKPFNPAELLARVKTHLELAAYRNDLEARVQSELEKNRLKQQLLYQQSKQAAIGELLMHIAHQWKQPLSGLGAMNLYNLNKLRLGQAFSHEDLEKTFLKTEQILKFMSQTVETFQNFYKPSSQKSFFDVSKAVEEALNIVSATYDYFDIRIKLEKNDNPQVFGNANEYAQVILNILNNAKDAFLKNNTPRPVVSISISKEGETSVVSITDNAGGIKQELLENIFKPFVSGSKSSGIGLYMSKDIIEKNGGTITAQNCGDGACFTVSL